MFSIDYFKVARENEKVFRNILRDLKQNRSIRPGGVYVPENLETEVPLESIFQQYSEGERTRKFTITNFSRPTQTTAQLSFQDVAPLSGGGTTLEYYVNEKDSVAFTRVLGRFMC